MDYGHSLEFGYFLIPEAGDARGVLETARLADRLGYDLLAMFAKAAATLDVLSGGRFEAGLGSGGFLRAARVLTGAVSRA